MTFSLGISCALARLHYRGTGPLPLLRKAPRSQLDREYAGLDRGAAIAVPKRFALCIPEIRVWNISFEKICCQCPQLRDIGAWQDRLSRLTPLRVAQALRCLSNET